MKTFLFALGAISLVGCNTTFRPIGPFAKEVPLIHQGKPISPGDASPPPQIRPTPPTMYVVPGDASANPYDAVNKLASEVGIDSKPTPNVPVTVETSRIKSGVK